MWRPLCSFQGPVKVPGLIYRVAVRGPGTGFGGYSERETPLPIPNREVKPLSADGTWPERARESRSPPVFSYAAPGNGGRFLMRDTPGAALVFAR